MAYRVLNGLVPPYLTLNQLVPVSSLPGCRCVGGDVKHCTIQSKQGCRRLRPSFTLQLQLLVGLPAYLYNHLQSVLNAAARSIAGLRRSDHITDTLASFNWLKVPERIQFKLATIVYRSLNGTAPRYLAADLRRLSDMPSRRRLRSSLTDQLDVRQSQCSTVGDRAFAVAGARLWNSLPHDIVASDTLSHFRC